MCTREALLTRVLAALHLAALWELSEVVECLLSLDATATTCDDWGNTALHYAAAGGYVSVAEALIEAGASTDVADIAGRYV